MALETAHGWVVPHAVPLTDDRASHQRVDEFTVNVDDNALLLVTIYALAFSLTSRSALKFAASRFVWTV